MEKNWGDTPSATLREAPQIVSINFWITKTFYDYFLNLAVKNTTDIPFLHCLENSLHNQSTVASLELELYLSMIYM